MIYFLLNVDIFYSNTWTASEIISSKTLGKKSKKPSKINIGWFYHKFKKSIKF